MKLDQESLVSKNLISRLAPTPSGFLHIGNGVNFVLTFLLTRYFNGKIYLRIDDFDEARIKPSYVENIFKSLEILEIDWDEGVRDYEDYIKNYSFALRKDLYINEFKKFPKDFLYPCKCSRKDIQKLSKSKIYPQTCYKKDIKYKENETSIRIHIKKDTFIDFDEKKMSLDKEIGDFVLWRKDNIPSYNFASLIDDKHMKTSLIVRGEDLYNSSILQLHLAKILNIKTFENAKFFHHKLLTDINEKKLSKSKNSPDLIDKNSKKIIFKEVAKILNLKQRNFTDMKSLKEEFLEVGFVGDREWGVGNR